MAAKKKSRDGLTLLKSDTHQKKYLARLVGYDPVTKRKIVDTERVLYADDKADGLKQHAAMLEAAIAAKLGGKGGGGKLRFEDAVKLWVPTITRHSTQTAWHSYGRRAAKDFGDRWLHKITRDEWERWMARQTGADSTIGGIKSMLLNLYDWAIENGHAPKPNPIENWPRKKKRYNSDVAAKQAELETPKKRAMTADELSRYLAKHEELFPHTYPLVLAMLGMGARYAEASALRFTDIDWTTGALVIRRGQVKGRRGPPKNDKPREAALPASALETIRAHVAKTGNREWLFKTPDVLCGPRRKSDRVPVWSYDTVRRHLKAAMLAAGARTDNATHSLRHTLKSIMDGEVAESTLRKVMGHSSPAIHAVYGDPKVVQLAEVVERKLNLKVKRGV
jgi:integrase